MECSICYESVHGNGVKCCQCVGVFHHDCLKQWYETKNQAICPYCKYSHEDCNTCDSTFFEPVRRVSCSITITRVYYVLDSNHNQMVGLSEEEFFNLRRRRNTILSWIVPYPSHLFTPEEIEIREREEQRERERTEKQHELKIVRINKESIEREIKKREKWNQQRIPRKRQNKMVNNNNGRRQCRNKIRF